MMKMMESMKNMSREEREEYFKSHKSELMEGVLDAASGGSVTRRFRENPNSEAVPYNNNWVTSFGYVCDGEVVC